MNTEISIIIPVFNEENRLESCFKAIEYFFSFHNFSLSEVIFVDDGSKDKTLELVENFQKKYPDLVQVFFYNENKGKGYAVRVGMMKAKYQYRIFLDADLSVSLDQINKLKIYMKSEPIVVIGSRNLKGSNVSVKQSLIRRKLGGLYIVIANFITGANVSDFTCGFKCFSKESVEIIFREAKINRWSFDAEVLFLAKKHKIPITEIPVIWRNDPETKVSMIWDGLRAFFDLLRIRFIHFY